VEGIRGLLHSAKLIGPANSLRAVRFARRRDRVDRRLAPVPRTPRRTPGRLRDARATATGAVVDFEDARLEVRFPRTGQVSLGWEGALDEPSYAVLDAGSLSEPSTVSLSEADDGWRVVGPRITLEITTAGAVTFLDDHGRVRRSDEAPAWDGAGWTLRTQLTEGNTVHGLGGRARWDLRGHRYRCWNTDPGGAWLSEDDPLYVTTPVYAVLDDHGAAHCLVDNPCPGTVDLTRDEVVASFESGPLRIHVSVGSLPETLDAYTALTGRPTPPPRWALGYHQARWGYNSAQAVREVAQGFRDRGLPLSAVHVDIDHMERFRNFSFGEQDWADPGRLVDDLAGDDVRLVVIVDAGLARDDSYPTYREAAARDHLCRLPDRTGDDGPVLEGVVWPGRTVFPDFTNPEARRWWGDQFVFYTDLGVAGFWHDMNEPSCFAAWGDPTFPLAVRHRTEHGTVDHRELHNVYGLQMCRASYDGLRSLQPDRRPFLFSRSGWAGSQRYGGHWSGDVETAWSSLRGSLDQCLGFGMSGVGYYGPDIGGFTGEPSPELFTRWFQLASFLPFFRTHCAWHLPRREPWEWGEEVLPHLRGALDRRYRLLPFWYTLALENGRTGAPYVRPLAWCDPARRAESNAFLLGEDVLVAPVLQEGATSIVVDLPTGTWSHGETGERFSGRVDLAVGPGDTPWFVRAGAIIPTEEDGDLVLLVAPPDDATPPGGYLLTDAGDGWDDPHHERYRVEETDGALVVTREVIHQGDFPFGGVTARALGGGEIRLG